MRICIKAALLLMGLATCVCAAAETAPAPQPAMTVTGRLHTGVMAIGNETTGTELSVDKNVGYELDLTAHAELTKKADTLNGEIVTVTGTLTEKPGVERGPRHIIKVETLEKAPPQK